jgi:hypothetical protein
MKSNKRPERSGRFLAVPAYEIMQAAIWPPSAIVATLILL